MKVVQTLALLVGVTLLGGTAGLGIGCGIGCLLPDYYRAPFPHSASQERDPVISGMGQGLTHGLVLGLGASLFLLLLLAQRGQQEKLLEEVHGVYVALERIRAELAKR